MGASPSTTKNVEPTYARIWDKKIPPLNYLHRTLARNQRNPYNTYIPECHQCNTSGCRAGECSAFTTWDRCDKAPAAKIMDATGVLYTPDGTDFTWDYSKDCAGTCPDKPNCTRINIEECWLGNTGAEEPTYRANWDGDYKIKCSYDLDKIKTFEHVKNFKEKFNPPKDDIDWNTMMVNFCSQRTTNCLVDPTTNKKIADCSLATAVSDNGAAGFCRAWYDQAPPSIRDTIIDRICTQNPTAPECKCHMRAYLPEYQKNSKYLSSAVEDSCVWIPCKGGTPAFLVNSRDSKPTCPSNLCQIVYNIDAGGYVDIKNNQNYFTCEPKDPQNPDKPVKHTEIKPYEPAVYPNLPTYDEERERETAVKGWIIIGALIFVAIVCLIIFIFVGRKKV